MTSFASFSKVKQDFASTCDSRWGGDGPRRGGDGARWGGDGAGRYEDYTRRRRDGSRGREPARTTLTTLRSGPPRDRGYSNGRDAEPVSEDARGSLSLWESDRLPTNDTSALAGA